MEVIERTHRMPGEGGEEEVGVGEGGTEGGRIVEVEDEHMEDEGSKGGEKGLEEYLDEMD